MNFKKTDDSQQALRHKYEISYEIRYGEDFIRVFFVRHPGKWFSKEDILDALKKNGRKLKVSYLYNLFSKLTRLGFLETRRSSFTLYRLKDPKCEIDPIGGSSRVVGKVAVRPRVWKLDFFNYLETLAWEDINKIHDVHLRTPIGDCGFVDDKWQDHPRSKYKSLKVVEDRLWFELRAHYKAFSLAVIVKCANKPVAVGFEGLTGLFSLLSTVRGKYCPSVPPVGEWTVKLWHYGRDTKGSISGLDFDFSFKDWFGNLCRIYSRHDIKKGVRAERVENPNVKFRRLLLNASRTQDLEKRLEKIEKDGEAHEAPHYDFSAVICEGKTAELLYDF